MLSGVAVAASPPFPVGEKLTYQIRWSFVPAGEAILEVQPVVMMDGIETSHFVLSMESYPVVDLLFKTRDRIDSYTDFAAGRSLRYDKRQRGKYKRDETVMFDWDHSRAQYANFGESMDPISLQSGTLDPLSALYYIRMQNFKDMKNIARPVTDGKKNVIGLALVHGREKVKVAGKEYVAYKIEPELKHVKGVFEKSKNARMFIWITDDDNRLPVRFTSEVIVGCFIADLIDVRR